jgi:hypothetical protein
MDKETLWKEPTNSNIMEQMQTTNKWSSISNTVQKEEMSYKERRGPQKKSLESKKRDTYIRVTERKNHTQQAWREEKGREDEERTTWARREEKVQKKNTRQSWQEEKVKEVLFEKKGRQKKGLACCTGLSTSCSLSLPLMVDTNQPPSPDM